VETGLLAATQLSRKTEEAMEGVSAFFRTQR
jgi:hypothetical protein